MIEHAFHRFDSIWKYQVGKVHHSIHERRTQHPNNLIECSSCHMFTCKIPFIKPRSKSTVPLPKGGCLYQNPVFIWDIYIYMFIYTFTNQKLKDSLLTQKSPGRVLHVTFLTGPKQGGEDTHPSIETDFVGKVLT